MKTPTKTRKTDLLKLIFQFLLNFIVFSSAFYFFSFIAADPDLWGHIKFGKDLWLSKTFHRFDTYSYTAYGNEWINHEWLSEAIMFLIYDFSGSLGLLIGKLLSGLGIVTILSLISYKRTLDPLAYSITFILSVFVVSPGFMLRPQIFTFLFTSLFIFILHLYFEREKNYLFLLPLIMILWVNCHGGFLIGIGMLPVVLLCELIYVKSQKKKKMTGIASLLVWSALTGISSLMNPYGYHLFAFMYKTLTVPRNIWEWQPINLFDISYLRFKLLALLFLCSFFFFKRKKRYWELGIILLALLYAFKHQRHTPVFAIVAAPYCVEYLSSIFQRTRLLEKIGSIWSFLTLTVFLIFLAGHHLSSTVSKYVKTRGNIIVDPSVYPIYAVHFLKQNRIKGNILLPFEWGEYAIWKLYPDCRVSIDGRFRTVYPQEVIDDHFGISSDENRWKRLLKKYPTDIILAKRNAFFEELISDQTEWTYIYSDRISMVFLKTDNIQKSTPADFNRKNLKYPDKSISVYFP